MSEQGGVVRQRYLTFVNHSASTTNPGTSGPLAALPREPIGQNHPLATVNVGAFSTLTLVEENGDGDLDVFLGASDGSICITRNESTTVNLVFSAPITIHDLAKFTTESPLEALVRWLEPTFSCCKTKKFVKSCS